MKLVSSIFSIISFLMVINVAWLHSAARLGLQAGAPEWMKAVWGLSVPYFFLLAMFWQWARFERFERFETFERLGREVWRLVKRLLVPYFLWCWLGAVWSIALHGVQLKGWEALRYLGLQPGWDPAYQPMWFLKALFVVLVGETVFLNASDFVARKVASVSFCRRLPSFHFGQQKETAAGCVARGGVCDKIRRLVFPVYVLHSMFVSLANVFSIFSNVSIPPIGLALVAVACSVVTTLFMRRFLPQISIVLFGGR